MRPVIVMHVLQEYRLPALEALKRRYPETRVIVSEGGPWASGQNAGTLGMRDDVTVLRPKVVSLAGARIVLFPGMRAAVKDSGADVMLLDPRMGLPSVWSLAAWPPLSKGMHIPSVWWYAGWTNRERPRYISLVAEALQRRIIRRASGAACYSTAAMRAAQRFGLPMDRVVLAQNATDTTALEEAFAAQGGGAQSDDLLHLLYVGRLEARKRLDLVVTAMGSPALVGRCRLRLVGSGPEVDHLCGLASVIGVSDSVELVPGTHDPVEIAEHLHWADVGILPNQGGLFLNTAMSCGVPVVCGRADGTEEDLVEDGVTGWRLPDASAEAIVGVLEKVLSVRETIQDVGQQARERYHEIATIDHMIDGIDRALQLATSAARKG